LAEVTAKYSGTLAGRYAEAVFAVTTAVEPIVTQRGSGVEADREDMKKLEAAVRAA